jgi:hypothetical protein
MNININDFNNDTIDFNKLIVMKYLHEYLDNNWNIVKKKNTYVLKKDCMKLIVNDNTNSIIKHYKKGNNDIINNTNDTETHLKYILYFLYNTLNNGWSIKKKKSNYVFFKKHEGKKEYISDNYITSFLKEHFNFK